MSNSDYVKQIQECSALMQAAADCWIRDANAQYEKTRSSRDAQIQSLAFGATVAADNFQKYVVLMERRIQEISKLDELDKPDSVE